MNQERVEPFWVYSGTGLIGKDNLYDQEIFRESNCMALLGYPGLNYLQYRHHQTSHWIQ